MAASVEQVLNAVWRGATREVAVFLDGWYLPFKTAPLPGGHVWVVGSFSAPRPFQMPLWNALQNIPVLNDGTRLMLGRTTFVRIAVLELWDAARYDVLRRRLPGLLEYYIPWSYLVWGRMLAKEGREFQAGKYLLLSGLYAPHEEVLVQKWKISYQHASPSQVISTIPRPCRERKARAIFPDRVFQDFAEIPCPAWWLRRPTRDITYGISGDE